MNLPLTKTLDPTDFALLEPEMRTVDQWFTKAREQHPMRRWEYAMALRALNTWGHKRDYRYPRLCYDVGGGGSPFACMLRQTLLDRRSIGSITVIDPHADGPVLTDEQRYHERLSGRPVDRIYESRHVTVTEYVRDLGNFPMLADAIFCLSVLEHVDDLDQFLYHLDCLVAPGGLLFLTMDCCAGMKVPAVDTYHFHWMRKRIFSQDGWRQIGDILSPWAENPRYQLLGSADWQHHGNHVYDYTFASLALVKRS